MASDGNEAKAGKPAAPTDAQKANVRTARYAQDFSQAVAVLMRDANYKNLRLADLEWLVIPPLLAGQARVALMRPRADGPIVPAAVALWARVSPEIDKRLTDNLDKPPLLTPAEWTSGNRFWLITLAGAPTALANFVPQLQLTVFKGQQVKVRGQDKDGKTYVQVMQPPTPKA
jgi:hemolysin-activating ACP:hemolysin acyltransferase